MSECLPTPQQLWRLTLVGVSSGRERSILRKHSRQSKYYYGLDKYDIEQEVDTDETVLAVQHSIGMRVVRNYFQEHQQAGWRLEYISGYHTHSAAGNLSAVTKYAFEWTPESTHLAKRLSHFALNGHKLSESPDIETMLDRQLFYIPEDAAQINDSEYSFSQITADDCELLTQDIADYYVRVKQPTVS
jgi:hypothetical protein